MNKLLISLVLGIFSAGVSVFIISTLMLSACQLSGADNLICGGSSSLNIYLRGFVLFGIPVIVGIVVFWFLKDRFRK